MKQYYLICKSWPGVVGITKVEVHEDALEELKEYYGSELYATRQEALEYLMESDLEPSMKYFCYRVDPSTGYCFPNCGSSDLFNGFGDHYGGKHVKTRSEGKTQIEEGKERNRKALEATIKEMQDRLAKLNE